jgi:ABC-2 type transport system permease protein
MWRVEIGRAVHRVRTWVFAVGLAGLAVLPVIILATSPEASGGPAFFDFIRRTGLFAPLTALALMQPFFLPLGTGLLAGESIAIEASYGTLRYLLVRPTGRVRLVLVKYAAVMTQLAAAIGWVLLVGLLAGGIAFGLGPLPTLSGTTLAFGPGLVRVVSAALYIFAGMSGLAAIGMFASTVTDSAPGATVATVAIVIISQILDNLSSLRAIHPYLLSHDWLAFVDLFRSPVAWDGIRHGLIVFAAYNVLFLGAALAVFSRKDVTS